MPQQPDKFGNVTPGQKVQQTRNLMPFAALTIMVFLRRDIGYRLLKPSWLFGTTMVQVVIAVVLHPPNTGPNTLLIFAWVSFALGIYQRIQRWREFNRGVLQHSFYVGDSRLNFAWLPKFLRQNRRIERFVEPFMCFFLGIFLIPHLPCLGAWLALSAACLRVFEEDVYIKEENRELDTTDGLIISEVQSQVVERFEQRHDLRGQPPEPAVPTGLGDDIQQNINRRKAKPTPQKGG